MQPVIFHYGFHFNTRSEQNKLWLRDLKFSRRWWFMFRSYRLRYRAV